MKELFRIASIKIHILLRKPSIILIGKELLKADPNMQVNIFIDTVFNIMSNLIPNETLMKVSKF